MVIGEFCNACEHMEICAQAGCLRWRFHYDEDDELVGDEELNTKFGELNTSDSLSDNFGELSESSDMATEMGIISLIEIPLEGKDLEKLIALTFDGDIDIVNNNNDNLGVTGVVSRTIRLIREQHKEYGDRIKTYIVTLYDHWAIGFITVITGSNNILYSFGIRSEYRRKEVLLSWINIVKFTLGDKCRVPLQKSNTRAANFFLRNGFKVHTIDKNTVTLCI